MAEKHYVGEVGTDVIVDCGCDITGATSTKLKVKKPDDTTVEWDATIYNSNYLKYTTEAADFDQAGLCKLQSSLTLSGWTGLGETVNFIIYEAYD